MLMEQPKKTKSKSASTRMNIANTLEKNKDVLNAIRLENEYFVDPMFHKMSKAFDEGGAKGMLMNNIRLDPSMCSLAFSTSISTEDDVPSTETVPQASGMDITDLVNRSGLALDELEQLGICPVLDFYRTQIGFCGTHSESHSNALQAAMTVESVKPTFVTIYSSVPTHCPSSSSLSSLPSFSSAPFVPAMDVVTAPSTQGSENLPDGDTNDWNGDVNNDNYDDGDDGGDYCMGDAAEDPQPAVAETQQDEVAVAAGPFPHGTEMVVTANQDYAFHSLDTFTKENEWAGARHWKYAHRKLSENTKAADPAAAVVASSRAKSASSKRKKASASPVLSHQIIFSLDVVDDDQFEIIAERSRASKTDKAAANALEAALMLPADAMLQPKDLCRLFLSPCILVPPPASVIQDSQQLLSGSSSSSFLPSFAESHGGKDLVWGRTISSACSNNTFGSSGNADEAQLGSYDDYDDDDGYGYEGEGPPEEANVAELIEDLDGLAINQNGLLKATRVVEKVKIGYSKVSKRVNIQKLKADIWQNIRQKVKIEAPDNSGMVGDQQDMSFQGLIQDLAANPRQKDVTVSFYFICLLHLANENTLRIEDRDDLSDLRISSDI